MSQTQTARLEIALPASTPTISVRPLILPAPARGDDLQLRVTVPVSGEELPVVVFSHGFAESMDAYAPLSEFWAASGFAVLQPEHLDSPAAGLAADDPRTPEIWRLRVHDLKLVLDELDLIESSVPGLAGRLSRERIAVAGHSWGATTASSLLGAEVLSPDGGSVEDLSDPRVRAGVLLAVAGTGGEDLTAFAAEHFPFMNPSFSRMAAPALVVAGDSDQSLLSVRGPDWWTDAYRLSPEGKSLLTLFGAEHSMGGIAGYSSHEATDWSLERIELIQQVTTAYLRSRLADDDEGWSQARSALDDGRHPLGQLESR